VNRHSIFFKLNLLFLLALLILLILFGFFKHNTARYEQHLEMQRGMELMRLLRHTRTEPTVRRAELLAEAQFELLEPQQLPSAARVLPLPSIMPRHRAPFSVYVADKSYYFKSRRYYDDFLVKESRKVEMFGGLHLVFFLLLAGLTTLYITLRRSLLPLKNLTEKIRRFAQGDQSLDTRSTRRDEIAVIANEFNDAVRTIGQLQSSRQLFLRNIMHELKTPLTRGKLALAMMDESEEVRYLDTLLNRMDGLINQFARIEKLQSSQLDKAPHSVGSLLQDAIGNLYLTRPRNELIRIDKTSDVSIRVDRELFVSALSNLLDNALKYATKRPVGIRIEHDRICLWNYGDPLPRTIETYLHPFKGEHQHDGGLGLGLYIVSTVVQSHGFILDYRYKEKMHIFCILFDRDDDRKD